MAAPVKTDVKKKDWPKKQLEYFERGMTLAKMKQAFQKLGGAKEEGEPDEPEEVDPDDTEDADPKDGFTVAIARAKAVSLPDPKSKADAQFKDLKLPKRSILIVKKKKPEAALKAELLSVPGFELPTFAFGKIKIDPENSKTLLLDIEGAQNSVVKGLKETIKKSGCSKVMLLKGGKKVDVDNLSDDEHGGDTTSAPPDAPPPPWNPAELQARLTALIHEFAEAAKTIPDKVADLRASADAARKAIGTGVEATATEAVDAFEKALHDAKSSAGGQNGTSQAASTLSKSGHAWSATLQKVQDEFGKLEKALDDHYGKETYAQEIQKRYAARVKEIVDGLGPSLSQKLEEASSAADGEKQTALREEARKMLTDAESYIVGNPLITQLDENPFAPLQTKKLLNLTIGALKKSLAA